MMIIIVELEKPDDVDVCDGRGAVGVVVVSEAGWVFKAAWELVVVAEVEAGATTDVDGFANPAADEKKAVYVKGTNPQPRKTVSPPLNSHFPTLGVAAGLFISVHISTFKTVSCTTYQHADPASHPALEGQFPYPYIDVTGTLTEPGQYPTAGDRSVATKHDVPMGQEMVSTSDLSALQSDAENAREHT